MWVVEIVNSVFLTRHLIAKSMTPALLALHPWYPPKQFRNNAVSEIRPEITAAYNLTTEGILINL